MANFFLELFSEEIPCSLQKSARNQILKSEEKVQAGIFYVIDAVNRRVDHLPKRKLTALKDAKTYDYVIKLHSEQVEAKASLKPLMTSLSFRF